MDSINIDKESFIQAHQTLIVANNILEGLVTSIKSVSCDGLPAELSSRFDGVKSNLELCYSGDDSYSLSSILNKIDEFIYKNASLDDFFMMYYSSNEMANMQQSLVNGDGEEIYSQYVQFLNELYSMGVFNEEEYNEYMYGAESMKNNEYDFSYLQPYYNSIYQKANDLYLNGLYKYYHDSEMDNSLLIGNITIEELYNATNAKLSEGPKRDYNKGFDAWRRDYGIDLDEAIFENSEEFKEYAALSRRLVMDDDLNDEELKRLDELSKYVDGYSERLDSEMALLWEKTGYTTGSMVQETFIDPGICLATGFISGVASVAENIIDGAAMLTVGTYAWIANDENTKQWLQTNVGTNWSQEGYYYLTQDCLKAKEDTVDFGYTGSMVGSMGGYMLLGSATSSILWLDLLTSGLAGAGQGGQSAIESGANFDQAYGTSLIAGTAAVGADLGFAGLGGANRAVATLGGAALASGEQVINTASQYLIYGRYLTDENGERLYTSYHDFMKKTGGYTNTFLAAPVGAFRGNQSYKNGGNGRIDDDWTDYRTTGEHVSGEGIGDMKFVANDSGNIFGGFIKSDDPAINSKLKRVTEIYEESYHAAKGKYNVGFGSYRDHTIPHAYYVTEYAAGLAKNVDGINANETLYAAIVHDLGMRGGYVKTADGIYIKADEILADSRTAGSIAKNVRSPHPLNSAISVLTEEIVPTDLDRDVVALLAMTHSKSSSGISYFDNPIQWKKCVDELDSALNKFNLDNGTNYSLDTSKLSRMIDDPVDFKRLQTEAVIIRDADAMSKVVTVDGNTIMQTGEIGVVKNHRPRLSYNEPVAAEEIELEGLDDRSYTSSGDYKFQYDGDGKKIRDKDGKLVSEDISGGVKFHAGELNTKFSSETDGSSYYHGRVELVNPNQVPNCTAFSIEERLGEVYTYTNIDERTFTVVLPKDVEGTALGNWYVNQIERIIPNHLESKLIKDIKLESGVTSVVDMDILNKQISLFDNIRVVFE